MEPCCRALHTTQPAIPVRAQHSPGYIYSAYYEKQLDVYEHTTFSIKYIYPYFPHAFLCFSLVYICTNSWHKYYEYGYVLHRYSWRTNTDLYYLLTPGYMHIL